MINTTVEEEGDNCANGGIKIEVGLDANNNGVLDNDEIDSSKTKFICNGAAGQDGLDSSGGSLSNTSSEIPYYDTVSSQASFDLSDNGKNIVYAYGGPVNDNANATSRGDEVKVVRISENGFAQLGQTIDLNFSWGPTVGGVGINEDGSKIYISVLNDTKFYDLIENQWTLITSISGTDRYNVRISDDWSTLMSVSSAGNVSIYKRNGNSWALNSSFDTLLGASPINKRAFDINFDGSIISVCDYNYTGEIDRQGICKIFTNQNGIWDNLGQDLFGISTLDSFGYSTSLSNDGLTIAISSSNGDYQSYTAAVDVFKYDIDSKTWLSAVNEKLSMNAGTDRLGFSALSLSNDGSRVSLAPNYTGVNGLTSIYTFTISNNSFSQQSTTALTGKIQGEVGAGNKIIEQNGIIFYLKRFNDWQNSNIINPSIIVLP